MKSAEVLLKVYNKHGYCLISPIHKWETVRIGEILAMCHGGGVSWFCFGLVLIG